MYLTDKSLKDDANLPRFMASNSPFLTSQENRLQEFCFTTEGFYNKFLNFYYENIYTNDLKDFVYYYKCS